MDSPLQPYRLLLVEAHEGLRNDLARALSLLGYTLDAYASFDAVPGAATRPRYAACILDQSVDPARQRAESLGFTRDRTIWTSLAGEGFAEGNHEGDPHLRILTKPFSIAVLERLIVDCLQGTSASPPTVNDPVLRTADPALQDVFDRARRYARQAMPIVIEGELGSGRRALAGAIHAWSPRQGAGCVSLDRAEVESSGRSAVAKRVGEVLEQGQCGSVLLVEPADWSDWAQQALVAGLRRELQDLRFITITSQPLDSSVREGRLALELQYRLDAAQLRMPPFRERPLDQLNLCILTARRVARSLGRTTPIVDDALVARLARDGFPGNQLGLESRLRSAMIRSDDAAERIDGALDLPRDGVRSLPEVGVDPSASLNLRVLERDTIIRALAHWQGNRTRASESLGISVRTLRNKIREFELR